MANNDDMIWQSVVVLDNGKTVAVQPLNISQVPSDGNYNDYDQAQPITVVWWTTGWHPVAQGNHDIAVLREQEETAAARNEQRRVGLINKYGLPLGMTPSKALKKSFEDWEKTQKRKLKHQLHRVKVSVQAGKIERLINQHAQKLSTPPCHNDKTTLVDLCAGNDETTVKPG